MKSDWIKGGIATSFALTGGVLADLNWFFLAAAFGLCAMTWALSMVAP